MLDLRISNSLEGLAATLSERIRAAGRGLFHSTTIVIPNATVRTYVQLVIARRLGIAANLDLPFLQSLFAGLIPEDKRAATRVLDRGVLQGLLLGLLSDEALLANPVFGAVREYLAAAGSDVDVVDRRRFQLATQLARVFDDYALSRLEMTEAWGSGTTLPEHHTQASTELWERALWLKLFGPGGRLAEVAVREGGVTWLTPGQLLDHCPLETLELPSDLHVFGFSVMAPIQKRILLKLSERSAVSVYDFCPGIQLGGRGLGRFGLPVDESLDSWKALGVEPTLATVSPAGTSLLEQLQRGLLGEEVVSSKRDESIRILACPSVVREVEIVAGEIWELVRAAGAAGRPIRFNEIAILLAGRDQDAYRSQIATVLPQANGIPVSSAELFRPQASRVLEAVRMLLDLPLGTFKRDPLLRLLTHPNVLALVPDVDSRKWLEWCDELEILSGADRGELAATYVRGDLYNWDQGLKRLALGAFMSGERSRDPSFVRVGGEDYLPLDHAQDDVASSASFLLLARALIADARAARNGRHTLTDWADHLHRLVSSYLAPTEEDEEAILGVVGRRLRSLEDRDFDGRPVSYRTAYELARAELESLGEHRGRELTEGVVVAPLLQGRPIPFKAVFILGLGECQFPATSQGDLLDLRAVKRLAGDVTSTDRDRLAFLETLAATRERLTLSYVARDATTGERLAPSTVVREVEAALAPLLDAMELTSLTVHHELRRYDSKYFVSPLGSRASATWNMPEAVREARVRALRDHRNASSNEGTASLQALIAGLAPEQQAAARDLLGLRAPFTGTGRSRETVRVSIRAIQDFLLSPLQGWAQRQLGLRRDDDDADVIRREDEAFEPTPLVATVFLREVMADALRRGGKLLEAAMAAHQEHARRAELAGDLPTGVFLEATKRDHKRILEQWSGNVGATIDESELLKLAPHRFGASEDFGATDVLRPPVVFELDTPKIRVELIGRTGPILPGASGSVVFVAQEIPDEKYKLGGFLDHALLAAGGLPCLKKAFRALAIPAKYGAGRGAARSFKPLTTEAARAWLATLLTDYLSGPHAYLLALEPVLEFLHPDNQRSLEEKILFWRDRSRRSPSDAWGPLRDWKSYGPPPDAEAMARRRLGPYLEHAGGDA